MELESEINDSQNGLEWKRLLEIFQSNLPAHAGSARGGCAGPHPAVFSVSPRMDTPQPIWAACTNV